MATFYRLVASRQHSYHFVSFLFSYRKISNWQIYIMHSQFTPIRMHDNPLAQNIPNRLGWTKGKSFLDIFEPRWNCTLETDFSKYFWEWIAMNWQTSYIHIKNLFCLLNYPNRAHIISHANEFIYHRISEIPFTLNNGDGCAPNNNNNSVAFDDGKKPVHSIWRGYHNRVYMNKYVCACECEYV